MSLTRSRFLTEPAIKSACELNRLSGSGLIVAHGSPSDPDVLDEAFFLLAKRVHQHASHWHIKAATLGKPGSLKAAICSFQPGEQIRVYPLFMSDGWFVSEELPRQVKNITDGPVDYLTPLGLDHTLPDLCIQSAQMAAKNMGYPSKECTLVLAAHGSPNTNKPSQAALAIRDEIIKKRMFLEVRLGFVDEHPKISEVANCTNPAICLPLFASRAGHVRFDIPKALREAGFTGEVLPPVGELREVPKLIANAFLNSQLVKSSLTCA